MLYEVLEKFSYAKARDVIGKRKVYTFQKYLFRHIVNKFSRDPLKAKSDSLMGNYNEVVNNLLKDDENDDSLDNEDLLLKGLLRFRDECLLSCQFVTPFSQAQSRCILASMRLVK